MARGTVDRYRVTRSGRVAGLTLAMAAVAAAAALAGLRLDAGPPYGRSPVPAVVGLLAALAVAGCLKLRFQISAEHLTLDVFDAILTTAVFALPTWEVICLAGAAKGLAQFVRHVRPVKAAFNVAQWMATAGVASTCYHLLRQGDDLSPHNVAALVAAMLSGALVNHLTVVLVLILVGETAPRVVLGRLASVVLPGWIAGGTINGAFGLLLTVAYARTSWAVILFFVPLGMLHWAGQGYAAVRADRARLAGLQRATHALIGALEPRSAFPRFLQEVAGCFEAQVAELVLFDGPLRRVHRLDQRGAGYLSWEAGWEQPGVPGLTDVLAELPGAARITASDPRSALAALLQRAGWRDCVAAPLRSGERVLGVLVTYDRTGMEGFEQGELAVAEALASAAAAAIEKAELVGSVFEERAKLAEIVGQTSDGIATLAADGTIRSWNPGLQEITGYQPVEMIGSIRLGWLRPTDGAGRPVLLERWAEAREPLPDRLQITTRTGDTRWLSCSLTVVPGADADPGTLVVIARDVTEAHRLERLKDDFVAVVSHELRTPLTPIKGWAQVLLKHGARMDRDRRDQAARAILAQSHRLDQLVQNVLEAYRIDNERAGAVGGVVDVGAITAKTVDEFAGVFPETTLRLDVRDAGAALGQPIWVERVLANLLSNAIKYGGGGPVEVAVESGPDWVTARVTDSGPGIPLEQQERIFERFERLDDAAIQTGTGLGLYVARRLAVAMGGTVELTSRPGEGATFTLRMPAAPLGPAPAEPRSWPGAELAVRAR